MGWKKERRSFCFSKSCCLFELFADFGSVQVFMRSQQCNADPAVPEHRPHTSGQDKTLGFYDLTLTGSYKVKTAMINTAVGI